jgi:prefoldin subunit 5
MASSPALNESIIRNIENDLKNAIQVFESEKNRLTQKIEELTATITEKDKEIEHLKLSNSVEIEILEN